MARAWRNEHGRDLDGQLVHVQSGQGFQVLLELVGAPGNHLPVGRAAPVQPPDLAVELQASGFGLGVGGDGQPRAGVDGLEHG
jgi:hypothetical protein